MSEKWKALHYFISFSTVAFNCKLHQFISSSRSIPSHSLSFIRSLIFSRRPFGFWSKSCYNFSLFSNCWPQSIIVLFFFCLFGAKSNKWWMDRIWSLNLVSNNEQNEEIGVWIERTTKMSHQTMHTLSLQNAMVKSHFFAFNFPCSFSLDLITFFVKLGQSYNIQF